MIKLSKFVFKKLFPITRKRKPKPTDRDKVRPELHQLLSMCDDIDGIHEQWSDTVLVVDLPDVYFKIKRDGYGRRDDKRIDIKIYWREDPDKIELTFDEKWIFIKRIEHTLGRQEERKKQKQLREFQIELYDKTNKKKGK